MTRITWNQAGDKFYEAGVDRGVLYPRSGIGTAWNGLIRVEESVSGGEVDALYLDGVKYLDFIAAEDFAATIEAFSAPEAFSECDGTKMLSPGLMVTQQPRYPFGMSYRTLIGNDVDGTDYGYKLHLVYNATASPSSRTNATLSDTVTPGTRSWTIQTVPPAASSYRPTAHLVVDSTKATASKLANLENRLYGSSSLTPSLPDPATVISILS